MKESVKGGKITNLTTMRKTLERLGEVEIVDETNGFRLDSLKETISRNLEFYHSVVLLHSDTSQI